MGKIRAALRRRKVWRGVRRCDGGAAADCCCGAGTAEEKASRQEGPCPCGTGKKVETRLPNCARLGRARAPVPHVRPSSYGPQSVEDGNGRRNHRRPKSAFVPNRRLRYVRGAHDFVRDAINLLLLVPGTVGVELHVQS